MAWFGFWLAVATFIFVSAWNARRAYEVKHETLRRLLDKEGAVDPEVVKELLKPEQKQPAPESAQEESYKVLRVLGTVVLSLAVVFGLLMSVSGVAHPDMTMVYVGIVIGLILLLAGAGLRFSSRSMTLPPVKPDANKE